MVKNPPANAGYVRDVGSIPELGRSPEEGNGNPLQYFCLRNPMDRGAWWATVQGVPNSETRLSDFTFTFIDPEVGLLVYIVNLKKKKKRACSVMSNSLPPSGL